MMVTFWPQTLPCLTRKPENVLPAWGHEASPLRDKPALTLSEWRDGTLGPDSTSCCWTEQLWNSPYLWPCNTSNTSCLYGLSWFQSYFSSSWRQKRWNLCSSSTWCNRVPHSISSLIPNRRCCFLSLHSGRIKLVMVPHTHLSLHICIFSPGFHLIFPSMFCAQPLSRVWLFVALWTVVRQAPLCMGFSRQKYWNGLPFPPPGNLPNTEIKCTSLKSLVRAGGFFTTGITWGVIGQIVFALPKLTEMSPPLICEPMVWRSEAWTQKPGCFWPLNFSSATYYKCDLKQFA